MGGPEGSPPQPNAVRASGQAVPTQQRHLTLYPSVLLFAQSARLISPTSSGQRLLLNPSPSSRRLEPGEGESGGGREQSSLHLPVPCGTSTFSQGTAQLAVTVDVFDHFQSVKCWGTDLPVRVGWSCCCWVVRCFVSSWSSCGRREGGREGRPLDERGREEGGVGSGDECLDECAEALALALRTRTGTAPAPVRVRAGGHRLLWQKMGVFLWVQACSFSVWLCEDWLRYGLVTIGSASLLRHRVCGFLFGVLVWVASDSEADSLEFVTYSDAFVAGASALEGLCRRKPRG